MGSIITLNDTLQLTREQGFPHFLNYEDHINKAFDASNYIGKEFHFTNKPGLRVYKSAPVRNFLVENIDGKWLYRGMIHVHKIIQDITAGTTSGMFTLHYIYTPEQMSQAYDLIDRRSDMNYLSTL